MGLVDDEQGAAERHPMGLVDDPMHMLNREQLNDIRNQKLR